jgi:putative PIN family toxin of toxin-antitoxin system
MPHKAPKVVFDTNIFISAIIFGGNPRVCLEMARSGEIELFTSKALLLELAKKLQAKFEYQALELKEIIVGITKFAKVVEPKKKVNLIKKDPSDNRVLEVAKEVKADFIISGDKKHILSLRTFEDINILTAAKFIKQFNLKN